MALPPGVIFTSQSIYQTYQYLSSGRDRKQKKGETESKIGRYTQIQEQGDRAGIERSQADKQAHTEKDTDRKRDKEERERERESCWGFTPS